MLKTILDRALKHHNHLASFPLGQRQVILDERQLMTPDDAATPMPMVPDQGLIS